MRLDEIEDNDEDKIRNILQSNFKFTSKFKITNNGLVNIDGNCELIRQFSKLPIKFGKIVGSFNCSNKLLTSLQGAPQEVGGNFSCDNNQLTSLQGAPQEINRNFYCSNNQLTSLQGAPQEIGGSFYCNYNQLTSLQGAPKEVGGNFTCYDNQLTSLQGAPQEVGEEFDCSYNTSLPLLRLLFINNLKRVHIFDSDHKDINEVETILNKYLRQGRKGAIQCAAELSQAGFKGNARL